MSKQLDDLLSKYAWNNLQVHQLLLADKKNLDLSYFNPSYNWEQLEQIRLCLEDGMNPEFILDKHLNADLMKKTRLSVTEMSGTFENNQELIKKNKVKRLLLTFIIATIFISSLIIVFWKKDFIISVFTNMKLELTNEVIDIGLSEANNISYHNYVSDYTKDCNLILPTDKFNQIGEYTVTYFLESESNRIKKNLIINVVDDVKPEIILTETNVTINYASSFDARSKIKSATDNIDGNLINQVAISNVDTSKVGVQEVLYTVKDKQGNVTETKLTLTVKPKDVPKPSNPLTQQPSSSPSQNSDNQPSVPSSSQGSINVSAETRMFYFKDYDSQSATQEKALEYANRMLSLKKANRYQCSPIKENGIYVGYKVSFS